MIKAVTIGATHTPYLSTNKKNISIVVYINLKLKIIRKAKNFKEKYFSKIRYVIKNKGHPLVNKR